MDTRKVCVLLLSILSFQLFQVFAQSNCARPACPRDECDGTYAKLTLPDGCVDIFCNDAVKSKTICPVPRCPAACSASPSKQFGEITYDGCCKCLCKGGRRRCPTNCNLGTKLITRNGQKKCVCETNTRCPPHFCPKNCPPGERQRVIKGNCKICTCKVDTCADDGSCNDCRHGKRYTNQNGCYKCACCSKALCPKNCGHGTEIIVEDGCKKCVCKCGPPICTSCPAPPPCAQPCRLVPEGKNGCDICKCPNACTKKCTTSFKRINGKKVCECCPPTSICPSTCKMMPGGNDGCGICKCPKCLQYKYDINQRRTNECCPPCKSPRRLEPGGDDGCGLCKCPGQNTCNKYKSIGGKTTCECCPTCKASCKLIPGGSDGCGVCNCQPKCPPNIMQRCKPHCRTKINGCYVCRCPVRHKPGGHRRPTKRPKHKKHKHGGHKRKRRH